MSAGGLASTRLRGRVWRFGDDVDTDQIIPARYAIYSLDEARLGEHAMEGVPGVGPGWAQRVSRGDVIVAGSNFGCGSSREIAPIAIRGAGIACVVAASFARIFFRNAINLGYPIVQSPAAAAAVQEGDEVEVDLEAGVVRDLTTGREHPAEPFPRFMTELMRTGGLVPWVRRRLEERRREPG